MTRQKEEERRSISSKSNWVCSSCDHRRREHIKFIKFVLGSNGERERTKDMDCLPKQRRQLGGPHACLRGEDEIELKEKKKGGREKERRREGELAVK